MASASIYDKILKLDRFSGSLEEYRRAKILSGEYPSSVSMTQIPTKGISGYVKDHYPLFTDSKNIFGELSELIEQGCIALVGHRIHRKTWQERYDDATWEGIPVMLKEYGHPYR